MLFSFGAIVFIVGLSMISWGGYRYSCDKKIDMFIISAIMIVVGAMLVIN